MTDSIANSGTAAEPATRMADNVPTDASASGGAMGVQDQTTPMEEEGSTGATPAVEGPPNPTLKAPLSGPQSMDISPKDSSAASQASEAVPMSMDNTPPASEALNQFSSKPPPSDSSSEATPTKTILSNRTVLQGQDLPPSSAPEIARSGHSQTDAQVALSHAQANSPDGSTRDNQTSPTLTNKTSPHSTTSPDLGMTRIDRPSQAPHHQSDDTHSTAATPASNSDDGTVHTSETSSGKSKALSNDWRTGSLIQKLPPNIIDRILLYVRMSTCRHIIPAAIRDDIMVVPTNLRLILWITQAWGMNWLFPLRTVSSAFYSAVRRNVLWGEFIFAVQAARRERTDRREVAAFSMALQYERELCFACSMNGSAYDGRAQLNPQFVANMGRFVPLCDVHEAALSAPDDSPMLCSNCLQDERRYYHSRLPDGRDNYILREDVDITYVEDDERFPQAESVCSTCRSEAFFTAIMAEDPIFRRFMPQLRRTLSFQSYVWQAEGTATEAAHGALEQLWLEGSTEYTQLIKHTQLQKRRDRLKKLENERALRRQHRELLKSLVTVAGTDSASELSNDEDDKSEDSVHFEDEDHEGNILLSPTEDRWLRDRAWHDWCRHRLDMGLWKSAHDQQDAELPPLANGLPHVPRIVANGMATKPTDDPVNTTPVVVEVPHLPPATLYHKACRIWDEIAVPEFFKLPMANIVEMLKAREDGFELSLEMDFAHLFEWLRKPSVWALPPQLHHQHGGSGSNATILASRFLQPPFVPNDPCDVGPGTVARIMEVWKRACAPLGECDCGICRRQKRKRSHDESNAGGGDDGPQVPTQMAASQPVEGGGEGNPDQDGKGRVEDAQMQQHQQAQQQQEERHDEEEGPRKVARFEAKAES
ncbi:hypothetical protein A4X13_0g4682 [Tilletia indica]|uniref:Uncharacterized protein n=1 Tax=Tilletia indica TaxID=43049 RepID=A0A177TQW8_9BASI|nr:hypothetical protein A4X13_0g4682 [Tilletia indica]